MVSCLRLCADCCVTLHLLASRIGFGFVLIRLAYCCTRSLYRVNRFSTTRHMSRGYNVLPSSDAVDSSAWSYNVLQEAVRALNDFQTNASELEKQRSVPRSFCQHHRRQVFILSRLGRLVDEISPNPFLPCANFSNAHKSQSVCPVWCLNC